MAYSVGDRVIVRTSKFVPGIGVFHPAQIEDMGSVDDDSNGTTLYLVRYNRRRFGIFTLREWIRGWDLQKRSA